MPGVCLGFDDSQCLGFGVCLGFDLFCLGMDFFERVAWGGDFQGLVCLGTSILAPLLLGDLLGVDLLGAVRQGCFLPIVIEIWDRPHIQFSDE